MPKSLSPIPDGVAITDRLGVITFFFRLRWQELIDSFQLSPTVARLQQLAQTAAIVTTALFTTKKAGFYRISYYLRKTVADGVASTATVTLGWTESGLPLTEAQAVLALDTTGAQQSGSKTVWADAITDLTYAVGYTSNTPAKMTFRLDVSAELLA